MRKMIIAIIMMIIMIITIKITTTPSELLCPKKVRHDNKGCSEILPTKPNLQKRAFSAVYHPSVSSPPRRQPADQ